MRRLNVVKKQPVFKVVKELDAFPKVPESYTETTASGGGISILTFLLIIILVWSEFRYYTATELKYDYEVDKNHTQLLPINVDITIAMRCDQIGADVVDLTGQNADTFGQLFQEPTYFTLTPAQKQYQQMIYHTNEYIRSQYHAIHDIMWQTGYTNLGGMPKREPQPNQGEPDACQVYGTLFAHKVAGNFHVTAGKHLPMPGSKLHMHLSLATGMADYNFSHRIDHFSFGEFVSGRVNPLDGDEKVVTDGFHMFQYFVEIVPTEVKTRHADVDTYQYAVSEKNRSIDHSKGSHGVPGIFVKYDVSSFKVKIKEEHQPYTQFLVRLCGIVGGVFATSGLLHQLVSCIIDLICCRYAKRSAGSSVSTGNNSTPDVTPSSNIPVHNLTNTNTNATMPSVNLVAAS